VQGRYYEIGAEISRAEQAIEHARELRARQRQELTQLGLGLEEATQQRARDAEQFAELAAALAELEPGLTSARAAEEASATALSVADQAMHDWQDRWETFNQSLRTGATTAEAERVRVEELENHVRRVVAQRERAGRELDALAAADVTAKIAAVEHEEATARTSVDEARRRVEELVAQLQAERQRERELAESAQAARREALETEGRIVSLDALQRAALGESSAQVVEWLGASGLAGRPRLAQQLTVDPGWERAVETVLGAYLEEIRCEALRLMRNPGLVFPVLIMPMALYALFAVVIAGEAITKDPGLGISCSRHFPSCRSACRRCSGSALRSPWNARWG
jgi:chromosome segregation protein